MKVNDYKIIESKEISYIELWNDCLRIHFLNKDVLDLNIKED